MNVLIVHAHHEPRSFNGALRDIAVDTLAAAGHDVVVSDLYAERFQAAATREDFARAYDPAFFKYQAEQRRAWQGDGADGFAPDIAREMKRVQACDLMIWQFPLWWFHLPAILKGWVDRVLASGFAYGGGNWFETAPLYGRRAILSVTTGGAEDRLSDGALLGDIHAHLAGIHTGILNFCGFEALAPQISFAAAAVGDGQRRRYLDAWAERLPGLFDEKPLPFRRAADFAEPRYRD